MLTTMENYLRRMERKLRKLLLDPGVRTGVKVMAYGGGGFFLSAAGLSGAPQPLAMGLVCGGTGWRALVMALGAALGYRLFWGEAGLPGVMWSAAACIVALVLGKGRRAEEMPLLIPGIAGAAVGITGILFLLFRRGTDFPVFFTQVLLAPAAAWFVRRSRTHRDSVTDWAWVGVGTLALARITPLPGLGLGYAAAGLVSLWASFPAAAMAGLGLDLARVTQLPMGAVVCCGWFARMLPFRERWMRLAVPGAAWLGISLISGVWDIRPLPGLLLGGAVGYVLPPRRDSIRHRGETGIAQVRLEMTAAVLAQTQRLLLEAPDPPPDEQALLRWVEERSCLICTARETCQERERLCLEHLHDPVSFVCRRPQEIQPALLRGQERLRSLRADRQRRQEYRSALVQQYQFLSIYLRRLADSLPRRGERLQGHYRLEVSARSRGKERANGDRCLAFPGSGCRYYVLLCDGMGTGLGAAQEGQSAGELLKQMLSAGFPPEHAFRSINSILALRSQAGAVTLDLAEIRLDSGRVCLYKWGAAPSWLLGKEGAKKIGTAGPPPGICVADARESVVRLSLRRGEMLILVSDGVEAGECLRRKEFGPELPPGELAQRLVEECVSGGEDDATAAVLRLSPRRTST